MVDRVWDRFLTDQDRAHLAMEAVVTGAGSVAGPGELALSRPALLLIDLYRWAFGDRPEPLLEAVKTWPGSCGLAGWAALPHIQRLLAECRDSDMPVVHVASAKDVPRRRKNAARHPSPDPATDPAAYDRFQRRYDFIDEVAPNEGELVIRKAAPSAFCGTPLLATLNYLDVDTLIVAGESTSGCVRAAVVDARSYGYRVLVPEECVFDRHEASHAVNLFDLDQKYADVLPIDDVTAAVKAHDAVRK